jgi:hypothetical protein
MMLIEDAGVSDNQRKKILNDLYGPFCLQTHNGVQQMEN